eukprot:899625_1
MAGVNPAMSGMTVGGNLNAGYDVARDNLDGRCGNYPKNPKGPKKCGKIGCSNKGDFRNQYWCTHDDTWYCKEHRHNHKSGITKCHGIGNDWVVQGVYLAKGRCDFVMQLPLKAAQLKCGQYSLRSKAKVIGAVIMLPALVVSFYKLYNYYMHLCLFIFFTWIDDWISFFAFCTVFWLWLCLYQFLAWFDVLFHIN